MYVCVHVCKYYACDMHLFACLWMSGCLNKDIIAQFNLPNLADLMDLVARHPILNFAKKLMFVQPFYPMCSFDNITCFKYCSYLPDIKHIVSFLIFLALYTFTKLPAY